MRGGVRGGDNLDEHMGLNAYRVIAWQGSSCTAVGRECAYPTRYITRERGVGSVDEYMDARRAICGYW